LTNKATLLGAHPSRIYEIIDDLASLGLRRGADFEFKYYPPVGSLYFPSDNRERYVEFTFQNAETATWFTVKYC